MMHQFLIDCPFTRQIWHEILAWLSVPTAATDNEDSLMDWWRRAKCDTSKPMRTGHVSITS